MDHLASAVYTADFEYQKYIFLRDNITKKLSIWVPTILYDQSWSGYLGAGLRA